MREVRAAAGFLLACTLCACAPELVYENTLPGREHDLALRMTLKLASEKSGAEFGLIRVPTLPPGKSIQEAAAELLTQRGNGRRTGRGVLVLYVEQPRQVKVEVSYGLEGVLPDAAVHRLEAAAGSFFLSDMPQDYFSELMITLANAVVDGRLDDEPHETGLSAFVSGGAGVRSAIASKDPAQVRALVRSLGARDYLPGGTPEETLRAYLESLRAGIGAPGLPLLTEGSRVFRVVVPRSVAQQRRIARDYLRAGVRHWVKQRDRALAVFAPGSSTLPVVLTREGSVWRVDEVKAWTWFHRFEDSREFFVLADDVPFREELRRLGLPQAECTIFRSRFHLPGGTGDAGDESLFTYGWFGRAEEEQARWLALHPEDLAVRWKHYHVLVNLSRMSEALAELEELYRRSPDPQLRDWRFGFRIAYREAEVLTEPAWLRRLGLRLWNGFERVQWWWHGLRKQRPAERCGS